MWELMTFLLKAEVAFFFNMHTFSEDVFSLMKYLLFRE